MEELNLIKPMATTPTMKHVGFTIPPPMEEELEQMAKEEHRTKSDLFREMVRVYRSYRKRHPEPEIDDEWVMQVIREAQEEEKRNPMTTEEILRESRALAEYGARQAKKVGIDVDDDEVINRIIHEERARWREIQKNRA
jgi:metal-responsive CopG/Arc/MetJ family transcriptional regulator